MLRLYSIKDSAADAHMRPWVARNHAEALRAFSDLARDSGHAVGQHPEDYSLWYHGEFDEMSGDLRADVKVYLGHASDQVAGDA